MKKIYYYSHARTALKHGILSIGLKKDDHILIPEYICDVLLHPIYNIGLKPIFFPIRDNFEPNWNVMKSLTSKKTKALIMVHYFGQPQNIEQYVSFCKKNELKLIEDNAHGHNGSYKGKKIGTFGDIGITSPRKIININSGGLLYIDSKYKVQDNFNTYKPTFMRSLNISTNLKIKIKKIFKKRPSYEDPTAFREVAISDYLIDKKSYNTLLNNDWDLLIKERRKQYDKLNTFVLESSLKPVYKSLSADCNPWCFPALAKDQKEAIRWFDWGWKNNKEIFSWPTLPKEILTKSDKCIELWKKLICFKI